MVQKFKVQKVQELEVVIALVLNSGKGFIDYFKKAGQQKTTINAQGQT
jgi:hypothetical protein